MSFTLSACTDITTLTLHQQCERAFTTGPLDTTYGTVITRVDGGWIHQRYVIVRGGIKQLREGEFVPQEDPPDLYVVSNVFDLAEGGELTLGLTDTPGYDFHVKAVKDGWDYYTLVDMRNGPNLRGPIFVPRAKRWDTTTLVADGTASLAAGFTLPTNPELVRVWVGNGAYRTYSASPTRSEEYGISGSNLVWPSAWAPMSGEFVTLQVLKTVSAP